MTSDSAEWRLRIKKPNNPDPVFPFLDLPAEIRELIYTFHFCQAATQIMPDIILARPKEPSLTRVSHILRQESLPVFYASFCLKIQTKVDVNAPLGQVLSNDTWYRELHPEKFKYIQHFLLRYLEEEPIGCGSHILDFDVQLCKRNNTYNVDCLHNRELLTMREKKTVERKVSSIRDHITCTLDEMLAGPGIGDISAKDLNRLIEGSALIIKTAFFLRSF